RIASFGGKRVIDTDHHHAAAMRELAHHSIVRVQTEHRPATAMHENKRRLAVRWRRIVNTKPHGTGRGLGNDVASLRNLRAASSPRRARYLTDLATLRPAELPAGC